ncbi:MAG: HEAT repeat domain-containing protein [Planctomycetales bacterium]|nr:HEAT repeat domain-containing protein [Planctomycetales bacterium]
MRTTTALGTGVLLLAAAAASADVVRLRDGTTLTGRVEEDGDALRVVTRAGTVRVPRAEVLGIEAEPSPEALRAESAGRAGAIAGRSANDAAAWAEHGDWCLARGLAAEAKAAYEAAVGADPDCAAAREALGYVRWKDSWVPEATAMREKGFVEWRGRWVLPAEREYLERREARASGPTALPSAEALRALGATERLKSLVSALAGGKPEDRAAAARELGRVRDLAALRSLARAAVTDEDASVRAAALSALHALEYKETPLYLSSALRSRVPETAIRAARAHGSFQGNPLAARGLAEFYVEGWGAGPRVNLKSVNQLAYIRDFDVEVAQAATIGDPIVGRIEEGVIHDYKMLGGYRVVDTGVAAAVEEAFEGVTGQRLGKEKKAWAGWLRANSSGAALAAGGAEAR